MKTILARRAPLATKTLALALLASLAFALLSPAPARANGYTLHTLYNFTAPDNNRHNADGTGASGVVLDGQGHLYGATGAGGANGDGTLFEYDLNTKTFTVLVTFNGSNGAYGYGGVITDGQGHLYGTTTNGGSSNDGTIYEYDIASGMLTTLVSFNAANGAFPVGCVASDGQGHLYGTTPNGGSNNKGVLFEFDLSTRTLTTLITFNGANGRVVQAPVILDGKGNLYGTTESGGGSNLGKVFQYNIASHAFSTLVNFNGSNGQYPSGRIALDGQGHLYGSTQAGANKSLYKLNLATHGLTLLTYVGSIGSSNGITLDGQGHLFGTTATGNNNKGMVFKVNLVNQVLTTLVSFTGNNGAFPSGTPTLDSSGDLFGTTPIGGANGNGTVFELTLNP